MIRYFSLSSQSAGGKPVFEAKQVKNSGGAGDIFMLPAGAGKISVMTITMSCLSASGYIKVCGSARADILAGKGKWDNLTDTITNETKTFSIDPVNAIRLIRTTGTVSMECTAQ